jgi:hypothetical protein
LFTVKVAALLATLAAQLLLNRARYCLPLSAALAVKVRLALVAPARSVKVVPPSVLTCHCTVGVGLPVAAALNVTLPGHTVWFSGFTVTTGPLLVVNVAALLATLFPQLLLNRARYCLPLSDALAVKVRLALVAPAMSVKVVPPSVLTCHCTVGVGLPLAAALNVTLPGHTVWFTGFTVTTGPLLIVNVAAVLATLAPQLLLNRA